MKSIPILLMLCLCLVGCNHHDAQLQKSVTGTWTNDTYMASFESDGVFTVWSNKPGHTNSIQGSWLVKDGAIVSTVTKSKEVAAGITSVMRLIRVGDGQLLIEEHGHTNVLIRQ